MTKREWVHAQRDMLFLMLVTLLAGAAFLWGTITSGLIATFVGVGGGVFTLAGIILVVIASHLRRLEDKQQLELQAYWDRLRDEAQALQAPAIEVVNAEIVDESDRIYSWHVWKQSNGLYAVVPFAKGGENLWDLAILRDIAPADAERAWEIANQKRRELGWVGGERVG